VSQAPGVGGLPGPHLVGQHVDVGVRALTGFGGHGPVGAHRPQGAGHLTPVAAFNPLLTDFGIALEFAEALYCQMELSFQVALQGFGRRIATARQTDGLHVHREVIIGRAGKLETPRKTLKLLDGDAGANDRAVQLVVQVPQAGPPNRRQGTRLRQVDGHQGVGVLGTQQGLQISPLGVRGQAHGDAPVQVGRAVRKPVRTGHGHHDRRPGCRPGGSGGQRPGAPTGDSRFHRD
jgi:hypothetical protein